MADGDFDCHEYEFYPLERVPSRRPRARSDTYLSYARHCLDESLPSPEEPELFDADAYENGEDLPEIEEALSPPLFPRYSMGRRSRGLSLLNPIPEQDESSRAHTPNPPSTLDNAEPSHGVPVVVAPADDDEEAVSPRTTTNHRSPWHINRASIQVEVDEVSVVSDTEPLRETSFSDPNATESPRPSSAFTPGPEMTRDDSQVSGSTASTTFTPDSGVTRGSSQVSGDTASTTPPLGYHGSSFADNLFLPSEAAKRVAAQSSLPHSEGPQLDLSSEMIRKTAAFTIPKPYHGCVSVTQNMNDFVASDMHEHLSAIKFRTPKYGHEQLQMADQSNSALSPQLKNVTRGKLPRARSGVQLMDKEQDDLEPSRREISLPPRAKPVLSQMKRRLSDGALVLAFTGTQPHKSFSSWLRVEAMDSKKQLDVWRHQDGPHHINWELRNQSLRNLEKKKERRLVDLASYIAVLMFRTTDGMDKIFKQSRTFSKENIPSGVTKASPSHDLQPSLPYDVPQQRFFDVLREPLHKQFPVRTAQRDYSIEDLHTDKAIWNRLPKDVQVSNENLRLRYATAVSALNYFVQFRFNTIEMLKQHWMSKEQWEVHCRCWEAAKQSAINNIVYAAKSYIRFEKVFELGRRGELAPFFRNTSLQSRSAVKQCTWVALDALFELSRVFRKQYHHAHWLFSKYGVEAEEVVEKLKIDLDEDPYDESGWASIIWTG